MKLGFEALKLKRQTVSQMSALLNNLRVLDLRLYDLVARRGTPRIAV